MTLSMAEMTCGACKKAVLMSDIRYVQKGDKVVAMCTPCREKNKIQEAAERKSAGKAAPKSADRQSYFCVRCKYKFKYSPTATTILRCPYCGRSDKIIENIAPDVDTLLKDMGGD
jgi:DNA-directed RNA polymerase subunit RPC12/RpoP